MSHPKKIKVVNTNSAGDAFLAGIAFGFYHKNEMDVCTEIGKALAEMTVQHIDTVNPNINESIFLANKF